MMGPLYELSYFKFVCISNHPLSTEVKSLHIFLYVFKQRGMYLRNLHKINYNVFVEVNSLVRTLQLHTCE